MYVVIVGAGKVGAHLARLMAERGSRVTLIEADERRFRLLGDEMETFGVTLIHGDGDEPSVLDNANIRGADAVVAATGDDEDNLVVTLLGKSEYKVPLAIARINNPKNEWLFTDEFGVDLPVSSTTIMVDLLERTLEGGSGSRH